MTEVQDEPKTNKETILTITNNHYDCCGVPPKLETEGRLTAYLENDIGEQLILQYDHKQKTCTLWHGDCGWEEQFQVKEFKGFVIVLPTQVKTIADKRAGREEEYDSIKAEMHAAIRKVYGKKQKLTDEECNVFAQQPNMGREAAVIEALYRMWTR